MPCSSQIATFSSFVVSTFWTSFILPGLGGMAKVNSTVARRLPSAGNICEEAAL